MSSSASKPTPALPTVCTTEQTIVVDADKFLKDLGDSRDSPVDGFYDYTTSLIKLGDNEFLQEDPIHGRLLLLGLIGAAEHYFRSTLAGLITRCPLCQQCAGSHLVPLSAVSYYSRDTLPYGLLEGVSLSSADEIRRRTSKLTPFSITERSSVDVALNQFDMLCQLRHAAIHARGELGVRNMLCMGIRISDDSKQQTLAIAFPTFQAAVAVCRSAVQAYNRFMFEAVVTEWIGAPVFQGTWAVDKARFEDLFNLFRSRRDEGVPRSAYQAYRKLTPRIVARLQQLETE